MATDLTAASSSRAPTLLAVGASVRRACCRRVTISGRVMAWRGGWCGCRALACAIVKPITGRRITTATFKPTRRCATILNSR